MISLKAFSAKMWREGRKCEAKYEGIPWLRIRKPCVIRPLISEKNCAERIMKG